VRFDLVVLEVLDGIEGKGAQEVVSVVVGDHASAP
jgi:hypothetical protein